MTILLAASAGPKQPVRNWDKVVDEVIKAEPEEKPEGDAALNKFFQDLYAKSMKHMLFRVLHLRTFALSVRATLTLHMSTQARTRPSAP